MNRQRVINYVQEKLRKIETSGLAPKEKARAFCALASARGTKQFILNAAAAGEKDLSPLQREYRKFFLDLLSRFGVTTPEALTDEQKSEFFTLIRQNWKEGVGPKREADDIPVPMEEASTGAQRMAAARAKVGGVDLKG